MNGVAKINRTKENRLLPTLAYTIVVKGEILTDVKVPFENCDTISELEVVEIRFDISNLDVSLFGVQLAQLDNF